MTIIKRLTKWPLAKKGTLRKPQGQYRTKRGISSPVVYGIIKPGEPGYFTNDTMLKGERLSKSVLYALTLSKLDWVDLPFLDFFGKTVVCINKDFPDIDKIIASVVPERTRYRENYLRLFEYNGETCYAFQVKDLSITVSDVASQLLDIVRGLEIPNVKSGRIHHLHDVIVNTEVNDKNWCYSSDEIFKILSNNGIHIINCEYEPVEKDCVRAFSDSIRSSYLDSCPINKKCCSYRLSYTLEVLTYNTLFNKAKDGHAPVSFIDKHKELDIMLNEWIRGLRLSEFIFLNYYKKIMGHPILYKAFVKSLIHKDFREDLDIKRFLQVVEQYISNPLQPLPQSIYDEIEYISKLGAYEYNKAHNPDFARFYDKVHYDI